MKKKSVAVVTATVGTGMFASLVSGAAPASADTLSPDGCRVRARGGSMFPGFPNWGSNCTVGYGFLQHNNRMVLAVQSFLQSTTYYQGPLDCEFGSQTYNAVKTFQRSVGLTADGVVGTDTWKNMQTQLVLHGDDVTYFGYKSGLDGQNIRFIQVTPTPPAGSGLIPGDWAFPDGRWITAAAC
jgi:hypothetical protein